MVFSDELPLEQREVHRLIGRVLNAGVVDEDGSVHRSKTGAPQAGPLSPLLANIYPHYVLGLWFTKRFVRSCRGEAYMVRYADDFVVCFEHPEDAKRLEPALEERLAAFGLELEPDKKPGRSRSARTRAAGVPARTLQVVPSSYWDSRTTCGDARSVV